MNQNGSHRSIITSLILPTMINPNHLRIKEAYKERIGEELMSGEQSTVFNM